MGEVIDAMTNRNSDQLEKIYGNFFRETCSIGLHGGVSANMCTDFFSGNITEHNKGLYMADIMHRFTIWLDSIGKTFSIDDLKSPVIGNPYGCYIDGVFFRHGVDYQHYYATMISRLVRSKSHRVVLELGGGFGGLAYFLMRNNSDLTYIDVDLPENMALAGFYLLSAFPDKNIALFGELDLSSADIGQFDAVILPNFSIEDIETDSVDLTFNSYSLAEMSLSNVKNYVNQFNRISSKFIYHINHTKITQAKADEFNFDFNKFELISRAPAIWNMALNSDMDEFEYIYKAKNITFS
jgi:putative sugar O-methyltransferase